MHTHCIRKVGVEHGQISCISENLRHCLTDATPPSHLASTNLLLGLDLNSDHLRVSRKYRSQDEEQT